MDDGMSQLRVRFSGVGQEDQGSGQTKAMPPQQGTLFGREQPGTGEEYDAAYAATVGAVAYAIAAREEEKLPSQGRKPIPEKVPSGKKHAPVHTPVAAPTLESAPKRGDSMKRPIDGSKISRWFSGKEVVEDGDDDEQRANVSVRRPVRPPAQKKPEGLTPALTLESAPKRGESMKRPIDGSKISRWFSGKELVEDGDDDEQRANVSVRRPVRPPAQKKLEGLTPGVAKAVDSAPNLEKDPRKRSRKFEQEQANQKVTLPEVFNPTASFPRERKESRRYEQEPANQRAPPTGRPSGVAFSSDAEMMAATWEKEKLAKIKKKYNQTMETIAEWEGEKKAKAMRQKEPREGDSDRKRAKALEEYNDEMKRINKVAAASRLTAEENKRRAEGKVREKAVTIRATGKLPRSYGCF